MNSAFGLNIRCLRTEMNMTQEEMASRLNITSQAISKWERGEGLPDSSLLISISNVLNTSIDILFGSVAMGRYTYFKDVYNSDDYYWGIEPTRICYDILQRYPPSKYHTVLDIGCGEGRDAVFFARNGYQVTAFDIAQAGIDKAYLLAKRCFVQIEAFCADMLLYNIENDRKFDIIYSSRVFQNITSERHTELISHYQEHTSNNGVNAFDVFVSKPFVDTAPDSEPNVSLWKTGEVYTFYNDCMIDYMAETVIDCNSSGVPHQHASNIIFARKYVKGIGL